MCDVHLIPDVDELRVAATRLRCGECRRAVRAGVEYRHIEGVLDDGSGERWVYQAHDDCHGLAVYDHEDGCFTYGGARPVLPKRRVDSVESKPEGIRSPHVARTARRAARAARRTRSR